MHFLMCLTHLADHRFIKVFFTKSYILGTDCHFSYAVLRTNLSLNIKSPIFYGAKYLIVLELAFLYLNFKTMLLNMFITLNFILHDAVFIYNIVRLYLGCKLNFFYIVCNTGHIIMLCESIIYIYIYIIYL